MASQVPVSAALCLLLALCCSARFAAAQNYDDVSDADMCQLHKIKGVDTTWACKYDMGGKTVVAESRSSPEECFKACPDSAYAVFAGKDAAESCTCYTSCKKIENGKSCFKYIHSAADLKNLAVAPYTIKVPTADE